MVRTIEEVVASLPKKQQKRIEQRFQDMKAEYMALQDLRKAMELTQEEVAAELNMKQGNLSRLEKRSDLMISTLRKYIEAMGGSLNIVAEFPNRPPVNITGFSETPHSK
ncbi:MAG: transcriptional regulator [Nitrospirales bacterium]|nr:MAG: transcriptional regulator [Nitrospirales bacterium]